MIKILFHRAMTRLVCRRNKHDWDYTTLGSVPVDNLDDTFSFWVIQSRQCTHCQAAEWRLKDGWEPMKTVARLTVTELT